MSRRALILGSLALACLVAFIGAVVALTRPVTETLNLGGPIVGGASQAAAVPTSTSAPATPTESAKSTAEPTSPERASSRSGSDTAGKSTPASKPRATPNRAPAQVKSKPRTVGPTPVKRAPVSDDDDRDDDADDDDDDDDRDDDDDD